MANAQALGPGETVDRRYRLEAPIADGGMSTVFLATDTRLDRHVALKLLSPSLAGDRSFVDRLELEAKSVARLSHPGVVQVFDHGFDRGQAFLVMELVPGGTLREILDERGPMPPHVVLSVLRPVLGALDEAHNNGLIHRDIKPENILVSTSNSVKLADFGLVRAVAESRSTSQNVVMGTAAYLAPEQIATGETDPRSDLYSLGIVAFELLTGRVPFQGDTPVATAYQRLERLVPPPSSMAGGIPEDLDDLILHATERNADSRVPTAREFLRRVEEVATRNRLFHVPVPAPSSSAWARARARAAREAESGLAGDDTAGETVFDIASRESSGFGGGRAIGAVGAVGAGAAAAGLSGGAADAATRMHHATPSPGGAPGVAPHAAAETTRLDPTTGAVPGSGAPQGAGPARTAVYQGAQAPTRDGAGTAHFAPAGHGQGTPVGPGGLAAPGSPGGPVIPAGQAGPGGSQAQHPAGRGPGLPSVPDSLRRKRGAGCLAAVLVLVLVVALGVAGWWFGSGRLVEIPSVSGMSVSQARTTLADAGLSTEDKDEYVDDVPDGYLLGTDPEPGSKVDPNHSVVLRISAGPPIVPEISADRSQSAVETALKEHSLTPQLADQPQYSADVPEGAVLELDPAPGTALRVGDRVRLVLSAGPAPVDVPRLQGMDLASARSALESVGLTVGNVRKEFDTAQKADHVLSTDPGAGASVDQGSPVSIVVSTAAEIPDVRGMPIDEARKALEDAGLRVVDGAEVSDENVLAGKAASTSPAAGEKVDSSNTVVTLTASNSVKVPMILGDSVSEASKKLREAGLEPQLSTGRTGVVYGQVPLPGKTVAPGSGVRISALG
ncbi:PASTA domain-containing protein [Dietzia sp.]|uniref:PASTA domain-containing protein n=1 Tax=Dietzia sp. TaxID=1871616 RepID=UPI002FD9411D